MYWPDTQAYRMNLVGILIGFPNTIKSKSKMAVISLDQSDESFRRVMRGTLFLGQGTKLEECISGLGMRR